MSERAPRGPVDPAEEFDKVCDMAASVRAFQPSMEGKAKRKTKTKTKSKAQAKGKGAGGGAGDRGEWLQDGAIEIEVEASVMEDGTRCPMLYWTADGLRQRVHAHHAFLFHPDTARELKQQVSPQHEYSGKIVVVDTGWIAGTPEAASAKPWDVDPLESDVVHEHGPAIVNLIAAATGGRAEVHLRQVRFDLPNAEVSPAIPVFTHPDKHPVTGEPMTVRGFTDTMLIATLDLLAEEIVESGEGEGELLLQRGDVVNLSLGAVAAPEELITRGDVRLYAWLVRMHERGVKVVCAAGNHGTVALTWPAAHGTDLSPFGRLDNVYAVGSAVTDANSKHDFSAHGWVPHWRNGFKVGFDSHYGTKTSTPDACWSGTSFAAPQFAVSLL